MALRPSRTATRPAKTGHAVATDRMNARPDAKSREETGLEVGNETIGTEVGTDITKTDTTTPTDTERRIARENETTGVVATSIDTMSPLLSTSGQRIA